MATTVRRISQQFADITGHERRLSDIWNTFPQIFEQVFQPGDSSISTLDELEYGYITKRFQDFVPSATQSLLKELNAVSFASNDEVALGYVECDTLLWMCKEQAHRILHLVGMRGSGKSYFVNYISHVCVPTLQLPTLPVVIDCRKLGDDLESQETADELMSCFRDAVQARISLEIQSMEIKNSVLKTMPVVEGNSIRRILRTLSQWALKTVADHISPQHKIEVVIIFDNLDQFPPFSVRKMYREAKSLALQKDLGIKLILSGRPFSNRAAILDTEDVGGYHAYSVIIHPPDLSAIIRRRVLRFLESDQNQQILPTDALIRVFDNCKGDSVTRVCTFLQRLLEFLGNRSVQKWLVFSLSNSDLRRASNAVRSLVRSNKFEKILFDFPFGPQHDSSSDEVPDQDPITIDRASIPLLLNPLMVQDRRFYRDRYESGPSPVFNLFDPHVMPQRSFNPVAIPYLLIFLAASGSGVERPRLESLCDILGVDSETMQAVLSELLKRGLITSPEHDWILAYTESLAISQSGYEYISQLLRTQEYIYNAVPDVRLHHKKFPNTFTTGAAFDRSGQFAQITHSLLELFDSILEHEEAVLRRGARNDWWRRTISISDEVPISITIRNVIQDTCRSPLGGAGWQARQEASNVSNLLHSRGGRVEKLGSVFRQIVESVGDIADNEDSKRINVNISDRARLEVNVSSRSGGDARGRLSVRLRDVHPSFRNRNINVLVGSRAGRARMFEQSLTLAETATEASIGCALETERPGENLSGSMLILVDGFPFREIEF